MASNVSSHRNFGSPRPHGNTFSSPRTGTKLNMKCEADRFRTYDRWPVPFMDTHKLAAAGLYYLEVADMVKCAFCGLELGRWEKGDDPMKDHKQYYPQCPYVRGLPVGNIPIGGIQDSVTKRDLSHYDVCGIYEMEVRPNSTSEEKHCNMSPALEKLGICKLKVQFPEFATEPSRMRTFSSWPVSLKTRPVSLCEAGFFYTGKGDATRCFHCGGSLKDWQDTDDPWVEHAKWFPGCAYVINMKGKDFIQKVVKENEPVVSSQDIQNIELSEDLKKTVKLRKELASQRSEQQTSAVPTAVSGKQNDRQMCKICFTEEVGIVFLPCGHLVTCVKCAPAVNKCIICRQPLSATVRAFLS